MPAYSGPSNGPVPSVSAVPLRFETLALANGVPQGTNPLFSDGLPGLRAWFLQTSGAGVFVSVQLQFADGNVLGGAPDWQPLVPAYGIVINVPSLNTFSLGSRRYRALLTATGGAANVRCRLTGALT